MSEELYSFEEEQSSAIEEEVALFPPEEVNSARSQTLKSELDSRDTSSQIVLARQQLGATSVGVDKDEEAAQTKSELEAIGEDPIRNHLSSQSIEESRKRIEEAQDLLITDMSLPPEEIADILQGFTPPASITSFNGTVVEELAGKEITDQATQHPTQAMLDIPQEDFSAVRRAKTMLFDKEIAELQSLVQEQSFPDDLVDYFGSMNPLVQWYAMANTRVFESENSSLRIGKQIQDLHDFVYHPSRTVEEVSVFLKDIRQSLKESTSMWGEANHTKMLEILTGIRDGLSDTQQNLATGFFALDSAAFTPVGLLFKGGRTAAAKSLEAGLRDEVGDQVAGKIVKKAQGTDTEVLMTDTEAFEAAVPDLALTSPLVNTKEVGASAAVENKVAQMDIMLESLMESSAAGRLDPAQVDAAFDKASGQFRKNNPNLAIKDIKKLEYNPTLADDTLQMEVYIGPKNTDGGYGSEAMAKAAAKRMGLKDGDLTVKRDQSGQYFLTRREVVDETTAHQGVELTTDEGVLKSFYNRVIGGARLSQSKRTMQLANFSVGIQEKIIKNVYQPLQKELNKVSGDSMRKVNKALAASQTNEKWFTLADLSAKNFTDQEAASYFAAVAMDKSAWAIQNAAMYNTRASQGFKQLDVFSESGQNFNNLLVKPVQYNDLALKKNRIYDVTGGTYYTDGALTEEALKDLVQNKNYVVYKLINSAKTEGDEPFSYMLVKNTQKRERALDREQLGYIEGGARSYTDTWFIKQAVKGTFKDTGARFMLNPLTHRSAATKKEAQEWADAMNAARDAMKKYDAGDMTAREATKILGKSSIVGQTVGKESYIEAWRRLLREPGGITDEAFEVVFDKELPSSYTSAKGADAANFMDEDFISGRMQHYTTSGNTVGAKRGENALKDTSGELSVVVDPMQAIATRLNNAISVGSYKNFIDATINEFYAKSAQHMDSVGANTPSDVFKYGVVRADVPANIKHNIEANREFIQRFLNMETKSGRLLKQGIRDFGEWMEGKGRMGVAKKAYDMMSANPIDALRGFAFDLKLGMFNISQIPLQMQTSFAALTIDPVNGFKAFKSFIPMRHLLANRSENLLDMYAKKWKWSHGMEPEEFKRMIRNLWDSGQGDVGGAVIELDQFDSTITANLFRQKAKQVRTAGREMFFEGERINRLVAYRMAWNRFKKANPKLKPESTQGRLWLADETQRLAMNMTRAGSSYWQHGLLKVPTQFKSYQMRLWENVFSSKSGLSGKERARLGLGQMFLYGSAGFPLADGVVEYIDNSYAEANKEPLLEGVARKAIYNGLFDTALYIGSDGGIDVDFSSRGNVGASMVDSLQDLYSGDSKSWLETMVGPTGSILWDTMDTANKAVIQIGIGAKADNGMIGFAEDVAGVTNDLAKQMSGWNNISKTIMAWKLGSVMNRAGTKVQADVSNVEALFNLFAIPVQEIPDSYAMGVDLQHTKQGIKELADLRTKYMLARLNADSDEEKDRYTRRISALMGSLDPIHEAPKVRQKSNLSLGGKTFYESMARQMLRSGKPNGNTLKYQGK